MSKTFRNLVTEVAQPKAGEEKAFKDQHSVQKFDAEPSGQDHIFTGQISVKKRMADYMQGQDAEAYDQAYSEKDKPFKMPRNIDEDAWEEKPMMMGALRAMGHYLQGIAKYVQMTPDPEEWYQNKLAGVSKEMQTLYGYATSEMMSMGMDEASDGRIECPECDGSGKIEGEKCDHCDGRGYHMKDDMEENLEEARNRAPLGTPVGAAARPPKIQKGKAKGQINAQGIMGKGRKRYDVQATVNKNGKFEFKIQDESGKFQTVDIKKAARMLGEETEEKKTFQDLVEMKFRPGTMRLKNGDKVKVSRQDAKLLTDMFKDLDRRNKQEMSKVLMTDKDGFEEIVGFAREAL